METSAKWKGDEELAEKRTLYRAFASHDSRFDGRVFVGVTSTKIYCRPTCSARLPKFENCVFFESAAQAESAGFRPCLMCRPETAPGMAVIDARTTLAKRAEAYLREHYTDKACASKLAGKLGYTEHHIRRVFSEEYGVTPDQYLLTLRLHLAKSLLTDSSLAVTRVAETCGFGSVRTFNRAFKEHYRLAPTELRRKKHAKLSKVGGITLRICYRPPYNYDEMLAFFESRLLQGVEKVEDGAYMRTVRYACESSHDSGWVRVTNDAAHNALAVELSDSLLPHVSDVLARVRRQFDCDCEPSVIAEGLATLQGAKPNANPKGVRLPGCFEPFETMCRAVIGQQITVNAANRIAGRIVETYGIPVETGIDGLTNSFPTPEEMLSIEDIEASLGVLGVIKTRSRVIECLAKLMVDNKVGPSCPDDAQEQIKTLLAVKGIGPWTANYIAMRALGYTDAFLESDSGIAHALPDFSPKERLALAEQWRPWRSYANIALWNSLASSE